MGLKEWLNTEIKEDFEEEIKREKREWKKRQKKIVAIPIWVKIFISVGVIYLVLMLLSINDINYKESGWTSPDSLFGMDRGEVISYKEPVSKGGYVGYFLPSEKAVGFGLDILALPLRGVVGITETLIKEPTPSALWGFAKTYPWEILAFLLMIFLGFWELRKLWKM